MTTHAWFPRSPCGPGCHSGREPAVSRARYLWRLTALVAVVLGCVLVVALLPLVGRRGREAAVRTVFRSVLAAVGVRLAVSGSDGLSTRGRGVLVVTNHVSWLDVVAVNAVRPMRALAKSDIAGWPVLGRLVTAAGSVYVDRDRLRTLPATVAELATVLRGGSLVNACPEGTTWCGRAGGRFRPAVFQAAIDAGVPVLPIALEYRLGDRTRTTAPAFVGDETIVESVRRTARLRGLVVELRVLPELPPGRAAGRGELAALAEAAVAGHTFGSTTRHTPVHATGEARPLPVGE
ncbi:1-acyl-sn-glycerol-3-phosphate acyltransferase [Actinophytocola xinjiangensis]|uniref:1-acyl-sn-glycerol-3-phosphate acyltransferase n=1 Tax=Actinophytocola xinjiangensis TaxID=485602 RepID=A0A7Z1AWR3_9PSEU|nr:lysophospholipid acyltransferase family protein [Actinophytocola xinjiangensis]OLF08162.1 1-acyl-sn-glycerol-3-phosphate acyltransferase [Actinophytocola xinjiangensis]